MPDLETLILAAGYVGLFAIVFAESGLFFGFIFPGDSLLFTAGFLASQGYFTIWILAPLLALAGILGDNAGYWTGAKAGPLIFTRENSLLFSQKRVREAEAFFKTHGGMSILLCRFIPAVRTFTPIIAGVAHMPYRTFLFFNILGGLIWGLGFPIGGYILGATVPNADTYIVPIVGFIIVVSFIPIIPHWIRWFRNKD